MDQLKNALNAHNLSSSDFATTLDAMNTADAGMQWKCTKGNTTFTITKNNQTSYNVQTDQED